MMPEHKDVIGPSQEEIAAIEQKVDNLAKGDRKRRRRIVSRVAGGVAAAIVTASTVAGCAPEEIQPTETVSVETPEPSPTPDLVETPTEKVKPTETLKPTETPTPEVEGNYQENLVQVFQAGGERTQKVEFFQSQQLGVETINNLFTAVSEVNREEKENIEIFLKEGLVSSGIAITEKVEKGEGTFDIRGESLSAPESLQFVIEGEDGEEEVQNYTLVEKESNKGGAIYINGDGEKKVVPLQFSLVGIPLEGQEIVGAVPYHVKGEESVRFAFVTANKDGEHSHLAGYSSREPFVLNGAQPLFGGESLELDSEGKLVIQSEKGDVIQRYNPDRGEWNLMTPELELAGEKVDWKWQTEGQVQGIPYKFEMGMDFYDKVYERMPIKSAELKNEELLGEMIMASHFINWVMNQALQGTGGINYWRNQYRWTDGSWQKASEEDMQRLMDSAKRLVEQYSFEDYLRMVQSGGGHYYIFSKDEQGNYDFRQVDPRGKFTYIRKENTQSGVKELHPGHPFSHEVKVTRNGELISILGIESFYNESLLAQQKTELDYINESEYKNRLSEQKLTQIRNYLNESKKSALMMRRMNWNYIPPTFTPQSLKGDAMQVFPSGRVFVNNFDEITRAWLEVIIESVDWISVLEGEKSIEDLDYPLRVELSEHLEKKLTEIK